MEAQILNQAKSVWLITVFFFVMNYLNSKEVKGYFRIYSLQYSGDNMSGEWVCTARLVEPSMSGKTTGGTVVADR